jgi:hypothetical protein
MPRSGFWVVLYLAIVHVTWAVALLLSPEAGNSTPLSPLVVAKTGTEWVTSIVLAMASMMSIASWWAKSHIVRVVLLLPQQAIAYFSAGASTGAVLMGHYADGVSRSPGFILTDQVGTILIAFIYTLVVIGASDKELR